MGYDSGAIFAGGMTCGLLFACLGCYILNKLKNIHATRSAAKKDQEAAQKNSNQKKQELNTRPRRPARKPKDPKKEEEDDKFYDCVSESGSFDDPDAIVIDLSYTDPEKQKKKERSWIKKYFNYKL